MAQQRDRAKAGRKEPRRARIVSGDIVSGHAARGGEGERGAEVSAGHGAGRATGRAASQSAGDGVALEQRIAVLEHELAVARARISELEAAREQVANRIDWAIDSLHSLLESEA